MAIVMVPIVFGVFPLVQSMASNADSLVLFDLARDIWTGNILRTWNLPRAPYIFPDTLIALVVMSVGWLGRYSIWAVATINNVLLVLVVQQVFMRSKGLATLRISQTAVVVNASVLLLGLCFPFAMINVYWQLFASGAHFLTAIVVLQIFLLLERWKHQPSAALLTLIFALVFLEALSDSMSALLLMIWMANQFFWRYCLPSSWAKKQGLDSHFVGKRVGKDLLICLIAIVLGTIGGGLLPRQSLLESFFSLDKFIGAAVLFMQWLTASPVHILFIALLIICTLIYPLLLDSQVEKLRSTSSSSKRSHFVQWLCTPALLPSLGILVITPLFYQEIASLRYLAFSALLCAMVFSFSAYHLIKTVARFKVFKKCLISTGLIAVIGTLSLWDIRHDLIGAQQVTSGGDAVGLSVGADASGALACIERAAQQYPLADGVATYWNARPTRFASRFQFYLAQINPWRPRAGYFLWGNNGIDFVYRANASEGSKPSWRVYNFVLATQAQLTARLWGSLPLQATHTIACGEHTVFYFEDSNILWQYLFPLGVPYIGNAAFYPQLENALPSNDYFTSVHTYLGDDLSTNTGVREGSAIRAQGQEGFLVYGPYISLPKGRYRLTVSGHLQTEPAGHRAAPSLQKPIGTIDVSTNFGKTILASGVIENSLPGSKNIAQIDFELVRDSTEIEFRIQVGKEVNGIVNSYQLQQLSVQ